MSNTRIARITNWVLLLLAALTLVASITVPEIRSFIGLDSRKESASGESNTKEFTSHKSGLGSFDLTIGEKKNGIEFRNSGILAIDEISLEKELYFNPSYAKEVKVFETRNKEIIVFTGNGIFDKGISYIINTKKGNIIFAPMDASNVYLSPDSRYLIIFGCKNVCVFMRVDLSTGFTTQSKGLSTKGVNWILQNDLFWSKDQKTFLAKGIEVSEVPADNLTGQSEFDVLEMTVDIESFDVTFTH